MGYQIDCTTDSGNTGAPVCKGEYGRDMFPIIVPPAYEIADEATAETESTWTDAIEAAISTRNYPWPEAFRYLPTREDHVYSQGDYEERISVRPGQPDGLIHYANLSVCFIKKLMKFNKSTWKAYMVTEEGYIRGTSPDGTLFKPFSCYINVEEEIPATNEEARLTPVRFFLTKGFEWSEFGQVIYPPGESSAWDPRDLKGLLDADLTISASSATEVTCDVKLNCGATGVPDLVVADFLLQDDTPSVEAIVSATESTSVPGRYVLDVTTLGADNYTLNLKAPADMTTNGYQKGSDATFTV